MRNLLLCNIMLFLTCIVSCKKENTNTDKIKSPFTVKYEISATENTYSSYGSLLVSYVNGTGQNETESPTFLSNTTPWTKTITVTTTARPLKLSLRLSTSPVDAYRIYLKNKAGQIVQNIYVNGVLHVNTSKTDPLPPAQCDPPKKSFNCWVN